MFPMIAAAALLSSIASTPAIADALPPPDMMRIYTVEMGRSLSQVLMQTTQFQTSQTIDLPGEGPFGGCRAEVKSWTSSAQTITCQTRTGCSPWNKSAVCKITFMDLQGLEIGNLAKITAIAPVQ